MKKGKEVWHRLRVRERRSLFQRHMSLEGQA
jgi:hypothetical protein